MANTLKDSQQNVICGLGDFTHTCAATSTYSVAVRTTEVPPSGLTITIKKNSSTIVSASSPKAGQQVITLKASFACTAADVIHVVLTSSSAIDNQLNTVKTVVNMGQGNYQ